MYNPDNKIDLRPDLCSVFYDTTRKNSYNDEFNSYRITGFYKAVPNVFKESEGEQKWMNKLNKRLFHEWQPNWYKEYRLIPCLKEEATHVCGAGVAGIIACLSDDRFKFTNELVKWSEDSIKEANQSWNSRVELRREYSIEKIIGVPHSKFRYGKTRTFKGKRYREMVEELNNKLK